MAKLGKKIFLLVSVRHVGARPDGHQHGVSIQISINLGKTFLRISRIRNISLTWNLARVFAYLPPFISPILDFIYWTVLIWMAWHWKPAIQNQPYKSVVPYWYIRRTLLVSNLIISSAGSRPWQEGWGGGGKGRSASKKFFFGLKIRGEGGGSPGPLP